jgi:hypothetical protein
LSVGLIDDCLCQPPTQKRTFWQRRCGAQFDSAGGAICNVAGLIGGSSAGGCSASAAARCADADARDDYFPVNTALRHSMNGCTPSAASVLVSSG